MIGVSKLGCRHTNNGVQVYDIIQYVLIKTATRLSPQD